MQMTASATGYRTTTAVLAIVASVFALSLGDAVIKATSLSLPLWQMYILRSALALPVLWLLARRGGRVSIRAPFWVVLRSALLVLMWLSYYAALPKMPLSLAAAAYYSGPIFILIIASLVVRRWPSAGVLAAIALGFVGVVLIVRPDTAGFQIVTLLPLAAALLYACAMVLTSAKCRSEDPFVLALGLNAAFVIAGAVIALFAGSEGSFIFGPWRPIDPTLLAIVAVLALSILVGSVGAAIAYQNGPPGTVAVFDYCYLVFSLLWGVVWFDELPAPLALIGIGAIFAAGMLAILSQRRARRTT
ncbi:MAG: DMT family transporter [Pseudomonadota bacterium]